MKQWFVVLAVVVPVVLFGVLTAAADPFSVNAAVDISRIAIDVDTTGNTVTKCTGTAGTAYPCNSHTTLGAVDTCRSVSVNDVFFIDIVGISLPLGGASGSNTGAGLADGALSWSPSGATGPIQVTNFDTTNNLVHAAVPGNNTSGGNDSPPDDDGDWKFDDTDVNTNLVGEGGQGIAMRIEITAVNNGTAVLTLGANTLSQMTWTDVNGDEYTVGQHDPATIVVGANCPTTPTPIPSPSPTPSPTPTASPTPRPTASPAPSQTGSTTPSQTPSPAPSPTPTAGVQSGTPVVFTPSPTPTPSETATTVPTTTPAMTEGPGVRRIADLNCDGAADGLDVLVELKEIALLQPVRCGLEPGMAPFNLDCADGVGPADAIELMYFVLQIPYPVPTPANCLPLDTFVATQ